MDVTVVGGQGACILAARAPVGSPAAPSTGETDAAHLRKFQDQLTFFELQSQLGRSKDRARAESAILTIQTQSECVFRAVKQEADLEAISRNHEGDRKIIVLKLRVN